MVLRDWPPRRHPRKAEIFACELEPRLVVEQARAADVGWHFLCDVVGPDVDLIERRAALKALGYRALGTEWLFVHELREIPLRETDAPVRVVRSAEEFATLPGGAWRKRHWDPAVTHFAIWDESATYGWVHSRRFGDDAWVGDLYVPEPHRRRGLGRSLMSALLRHDRDAGVKRSVLLASSAGAQLYPLLGYELAGVLQLMCPRSRTQPLS